MKKIISLIVSAIIVAGLAIGIIAVVNNINNNKEYALTVSTSYGGTIKLTIDDEEFTIKSDKDQTYTVKKKSKINLIAVPDDSYYFVKWDLNGKQHSEENEIALTVEQESIVKAEFETKSIKVTVTDSDFSDEFDMKMSDNLLTELNSKYSAPKGYRYVYKIDGKVVDSNTTIKQATTITREKVAIEYTVTFKHKGEQVGEIVTYTIENKESITYPTIPTEKGYIVSWEEMNLNNLGNIVVNTVRTPIEYTVIFKLPEGYTYADGTTSISKIYYITDSFETLEKPNLSEYVVSEHYELTWPATELTYNETTALEITAVQSAVNYTVTFKNGDDVVATRTFTVENKTIETPEVPDVEHYKDEAWEAYNLETLADITVNLIKTPIIYTVSFKYGDTLHGTDIYTIEDQEISLPAVPNLKYYENEAWPEVVIPENLGDFEVQLLKTPIQYTVTYKLPSGYTFDGQNASIEKVYTIENYDSEQGLIIEERPTLPTPKKGYSISWENFNITLDNIETVKYISAIESEIIYTATFKNGETVIEEKTFTINTYEDFTEATLPTEAGFVYKWEKYSIDPDNLTDFTVNAVKLVQVRINYELTSDAELVYELNDNFGYTIAYVAIDSEGKVVLDGTTPVIYKTVATNQVDVRTNLIETINSAVHNPNDANDKPVISELELTNGSNPTTYRIDIENTLEKQLYTALQNCTTGGYQINVTFDAVEEE